LQELAPVTVIRTMQGFGKTTLVTAWLESLSPANFIPIWVSLTAGLGTRDQFGAHLRRQLEGADLLDVTAAALQPTPPLVEFDEILVGVAGDRKLILVIDNLAYLTDEHLAADLVTLVQRHRNLHLVLCTRAFHPIERLAIGAVAVSILQTEDLQLTVPEIRQLADAMGVTMGEGEGEQMHAEIGGWIAPLRLMLESMRSGLPWQAVAEDYIRNTALPSDREKAFVDSLMHYSLAERLDVAMVRDLAEPGDTGALDAVRVMERPGLLERRYVDGREVFVFPETLRRLLREGMTREPDIARAFHRRIAVWFARNCDDADAALAFHHAIAGEDFELAYRVWCDHVLAMDMTRPELVAQSLRSIPTGILEQFPGMAVTKAVAAAIEGDSDVDARMTTVRALVDASNRVVAAGIQDLSLSDLLYVAAGHMIGMRQAGRFDDAVTFGEQVTERAARLRTARDPAHALTSWLDLQQGLSSTLQGDHDAAIGHYLRAWERAQLGSRSYVAANAAANLAMTHTLRGETLRARVWGDRHAQLSFGSYWSDHLVGIGAHVAAALRALDELDKETAKAELALVGDGSDALDLWPFIAHVNAQYGLIFGDPRNALSMLNRAVLAHPSASRNAGVAVELIARARADLLTAANRAQRARLIVMHGDRDRPSYGIPLARLLLLSGEPGKARGLAAGLLANSRLPLRDRLDALLADAAAAARMGDGRDASARIEHARFLADETGILSAFASLTAVDRDALAVLLTRAGQIPNLRPVFPDHVALVDLSPREQLLLETLATTPSRREIAQQLFVSVNTVKTQLANLYAKLGTTTRDETVLKAQQLGLLT
jgi:LuxR family maltose regulon positive regulatory protein